MLSPLICIEVCVLAFTITVLQFDVVTYVLKRFSGNFLLHSWQKNSLPAHVYL